jgi:hypothetical protein
VVAFKKPVGIEKFDEHLVWLMDCEYYARMVKRFGEPALVQDVTIRIGEDEDSITNTVSGNVRLTELAYVQKKIGSTNKYY